MYKNIFANKIKVIEKLAQCLPWVFPARRIAPAKRIPRPPLQAVGSRVGRAGYKKRLENFHTILDAFEII